MKRIVNCNHDFLHQTKCLFRGGLKNAVRFCCILSLTLIMLSTSLPVFADGNQIKIAIDGVEKTTNTPPILVDNRVYVPLRFVGEALGANVEYFSDNAVPIYNGSGVIYSGYQVRITQKLNDQYSQVATFSTSNNKIGRHILDYTSGNILQYPVDPYQSDAQIKNIDGSMYAPVRAVSEALGISVEWNQDDQCVFITSANKTEVINGLLQERKQSHSQPEDTYKIDLSTDYVELDQFNDRFITVGSNCMVIREVKDGNICTAGFIDGTTKSNFRICGIQPGTTTIKIYASESPDIYKAITVKVNPWKQQNTTNTTTSNTTTSDTINTDVTTPTTPTDPVPDSEKQPVRTYVRQPDGTWQYEYVYPE